MPTKLKLFYIAMQAWIDSGFKVNPHGFIHCVGLCTNALRYDIATGDFNHEAHTDLKNHLASSFDGDAECPFNGCLENYHREKDYSSMYQNPKRLAWIKEHSQ